MMRTLLKLFTLPIVTLAAFLGTLEIQATPYNYSNSVFKITAVIDGQNTLSQSGFAVITDINGTPTKGIVTALHGVVKSERYLKIVKDYKVQELELAYADVKNDVAFLLPKKEWIIQPDFFSEFKNVKPTDNSKDILLSGFPINFDVIRTRTLKISDPSLPKLREFGILDEQVWSKRDSPSLDSEIISLDGNILPGDSGSALILDDKIVGVGNGGFYQGQTSIGWAIPWSAVNLRSVQSHAVRTLLNSLKTLNIPSSVYYFDDRGKALYSNQIIGGVPCQMGEDACWAEWIKEARESIEQLELPKLCQNPSLISQEDGKQLVKELVDDSIAVQNQMGKTLSSDQQFMKKILDDTKKQLTDWRDSVFSDGWKAQMQDELNARQNCATLQRHKSNLHGNCLGGLGLLENITKDDYCKNNNITTDFQCKRNMKMQWQSMNKSFAHCDETVFSTNWLDQLL